MRILIYEEIRKEQVPFSAFSWALMRAIDPRLVTRRPRGISKTILMKELGMEISMPESTDVKGKAERKKLLDSM